jgi:hypothetical protein
MRCAILDKRTVSVRLPNGHKTQSTTVGRLRRAFRKQSEAWKENFFYNLLNNGFIEQSGVTYWLDSFTGSVNPLQ